ncbi:MAG: hypothetical protein QMB03_13790 [Spirosomataceae bacterium]
MIKIMAIPTHIENKYAAVPPVWILRSLLLNEFTKLPMPFTAPSIPFGSITFAKTRERASVG